MGAAESGHEHITDAQLTTTLTNVFGTLSWIINLYRK